MVESCLGDVMLKVKISIYTTPRFLTCLLWFRENDDNMDTISCLCFFGPTTGFKVEWEPIITG